VTTHAPHRDLTRTMLSIIVISLLIAASFWVVSPFLPALIWAATIVVSTWPIMRALQKRLWGKRGLTVAVMTVLLLLVLVVPVTFAVVTIVDKADQIASISKSLKGYTLPHPPEWVQRVPIVGSRAAVEWQQVASGGPEALSARLSPYASKVLKWFASQAGSVGMMMLQFLLTVIIAAILYSSGETAARGIILFARRLAGERGENVVVIAAQSVRAVALGVVVTALVQSVFAGIGLAIAGIPYVAFLTALMFVLAIAQLGPGLVLIPAIIWLYWSGDALWGTVLLVWSIVAASFDNVLRPILIKKGAKLPLLLVFAGVIGGLIAFGVIGLFIGPVVLVVTYTLLASWVSENGREDTTPPDKAGEGS
jgi:predicted PurR-regulated permease PerM